MSCLKLYGPAIVLLIWAATWAAGARGDGLLALWLIAVAASVAAAEWERQRLRRARGPRVR